MGSKLVVLLLFGYDVRFACMLSVVCVLLFFGPCILNLCGSD